MFKKLALVLLVSVPFFANSLNATCATCCGNSCKKSQRCNVKNVNKTRGCQGGCQQVGCCGGSCSIR